MKKPILEITIKGAPASGKTTLAFGIIALIKTSFTLRPGLNNPTIVILEGKKNRTEIKADIIIRTTTY